MKNINKFLVQSTSKEAALIIEHEQTIRLSCRDSKRLLDLIENPPAASARLKQAFKHYHENKRNDMHPTFSWKP